MAAKSNLVNLDAMIKRADFAYEKEEQDSFEKFHNIPVREFLEGGLTGPVLRKPDFQRETNHWSPEQVVSLLECYINGDLIPSVILWKSSAFLFVIDGGHRLSVLKAWVEDDYGDGQMSHKLFGHDIPIEQKKAAERTRKLVKERVGTWSYYKSLLANNDDSTHEQLKKLNTITTRGLQVQWVQGDADKAASSFFNINMKGTPLDEIEETLLRNRKKPIPIAARAIIRAGKGHRYWSSFGQETSEIIEREASQLHKLLFNPEINNPIKTLDLPLGGSKGVRSAIQILIDFLLIANKRSQAAISKIDEYDDDISGDLTVSVLRNAARLASRITGNGDGSLGIHPAIYFYGPTGRHSIPMFLGTISMIAEQLANNNKEFFKKFTSIRGELENLLISNKELIAMILQKNISRHRIPKHHMLLKRTIESLNAGNKVTEQDLISFAELEGKIIAGDFKKSTSAISDDEKSKVFINVALRNAIRCPICDGFLDVEKSVSYDHIKRVREGGNGGADNCQLTHPYCNQSIKC